MEYVDFVNLDNSRSGGYSKYTKLLFSETKGRVETTKDLPLAVVPSSLVKRVFDSVADFSYGGEVVLGTPAGIRMYTPHTSVVIKVPEADTLGTEFFQQAMAIKYTIRSIDFAASKTKSLSGTSEGEKGSIGISVDISKLMSKESFGEVSAEYETSFAKAFVFHVETGKKYLLVIELKSLIENYSVRLEKLTVQDKGKTYTVGERNVTVWMQMWMEGINSFLDEHFRTLEKRWGRE